MDRITNGQEQIVSTLSPYKHKKSARRLSDALSTWLGTESNCRHGDFQSLALPTELPSRSASSEWLGTESNCRHGDFQSLALPTELPSHIRTAANGLRPEATRLLRDCIELVNLFFIYAQGYVACATYAHAARLSAIRRAKIKKIPKALSLGDNVLGEIRTRVGGVKGLCPGPLDDEDNILRQAFRKIHGSVLGEIRTRVGGVKGLCPGPLDDEDIKSACNLSKYGFWCPRRDSNSRRRRERPLSWASRRRGLG